MRSLIVAVGEQPPSSMTPVILELESGGLLVIGGSGGSMITSAVALVSPLKSVFARLSICRLFLRRVCAPAGNNEPSVAQDEPEGRHHGAHRLR